MIKCYKLTLHSILLFFVVIYIATPLHMPYNFSYYAIGVLLYLVGLFCFYKITRKKNYFDFDTLFLSFCTIEHLMGGLYLDTEEFSRLFVKGVDTTMVMKASILSIVGLLSYMEGSIYISKKQRCPDFTMGLKYGSLEMMFVLFVIMAFLYYIAGGYDFFRSQYSDGVGMSTASGLVFQAQTLMVTFAHLYCVVLFLKILSGKCVTLKQKMQIVIIIAIATSIVIVGNRTSFSFIVLPFVMCYAAFIKPLNIKKTALFGIIGVVAMYVIQRTRAQHDVQLAAFFFLFSDVIAPSRTLYAAMEFVDKAGLNYGLTMLPPIIGTIPSLSRFLGEWTTIGSAEFMTQYLADGTNNSGLGTTIIVDIYLCFGFIGVIFLMYLLGRFVHKQWKSPLTHLIIQTSLFSSCIFIGRSSYLLPLQGIVWGLIIMAFFKYLSKGHGKNSVLSR